jgi:hypothetical protein
MPAARHPLRALSRRRRPVALGLQTSETVVMGRLLPSGTRGGALMPEDETRVREGCLDEIAHRDEADQPPAVQDRQVAHPPLGYDTEAAYWTNWTAGGM